jgi:hypothetical protein
MWRLTDEAIREGVKSTTRYRSKAPNKRGHRTQQPQPQRQASGAKGGQAARRSARMKRSGRLHDGYRNGNGEGQYILRSVPAAFDPNYRSIPADAYPPSPYYGSDVDFGYPSSSSSRADDFAVSHNNSGMLGPHHHAHLDIFSPATRSYPGSPMSQHDLSHSLSSQGISQALPHGLPITDTAYVLDQSPVDGLFSNSPSPSADEPRTPIDQGGWREDVALGMEMGMGVGQGAGCVFEDGGMGYRAYTG